MIRNLIRIAIIILITAAVSCAIVLADGLSISADPKKLEFQFISNDPYHPLVNQTQYITLSNPNLYNWQLQLENNDHWLFLNIWPTGGSQAGGQIEITLKPEYFLAYGGGNPEINITASYFDVEKQETIYETIKIPVYISVHEIPLLYPDRGVQGQTVYAAVPLGQQGPNEPTLEDYQELLELGPYITNNNPGVHVEDITIDEVNMEAVIKAKIDQNTQIGPSNFIVHFDKDTSSVSEDDAVLYFWVISKFSPDSAKQGQTLDIQFTHYKKLVLDTPATADWLKNSLIFNAPGITVNNAAILTGESSTLVTYNITIDEDTKTSTIYAASPLVGNDNVMIPFTVLPKTTGPTFEADKPVITYINPSSVFTLEAANIYGLKFGVEPGEIWIDGIEASYESWSNDSVTRVIVPANVIPGKARITLITTFETDAEYYIYVKTPTSEPVAAPTKEPEAIIIAIDQLIPPAGPAGTEVRILGKDFGSSQGNSYVFFGNQANKVKVIKWASSEITAIVPTLYIGDYDVKVVKVPDLTDVTTIQESNTEKFNITFLASAGQAAIYPNPFNPIALTSTTEATIAYTGTPVSLLGFYIYDLSGLLIHKEATANTQTSWNGYNDQGKLCGDGPYLVRVVDENTKALLAKGKVLIIKQ